MDERGRDARLAVEESAIARIVGLSRPDLLERDIAAELPIERMPDFTQTATFMKTSAKISAQWLGMIFTLGVVQ
jgi:hypothetical protein